MEQYFFDKYKHLLKNQWILAGLLFVFTIVFGLLLIAVTGLLGFDNTVSVISVLLAALSVGMIYTHTFNEIMPNKLRFNVTVVYVIGQMVLALIYIFVLVPQLLLLALAAPSMFIIGAAVMIGINLLVGLVIYRMLGSGGKSVLKSKEKFAEAKESKKL